MVTLDASWDGEVGYYCDHALQTSFQHFSIVRRQVAHDTVLDLVSGDLTDCSGYLHAPSHPLHTLHHLHPLSHSVFVVNLGVTTLVSHTFCDSAVSSVVPWTIMIDREEVATESLHLHSYGVAPSGVVLQATKVHIPCDHMEGDRNHLGIACGHGVTTLDLAHCCDTWHARMANHVPSGDNANHGNAPSSFSGVTAPPNGGVHGTCGPLVGEAIDRLEYHLSWVIHGEVADPCGNEELPSADLLGSLDCELGGEYLHLDGFYAICKD